VDIFNEVVGVLYLWWSFKNYQHRKQFSQRGF